LDIGCGTGTIITHLAVDETFEIYGCDSSVDMLQKVQRHNNIHITCSVSDLLPYPEDSFDMVIAVAVFHHLGTEEVAIRTVKEMLRVTRRSGKVIIWDANPLNPYWLLLFKRIPYDKDVKKPMPLLKIIFKTRNINITGVEIIRSGWVPDFAPKKMLYLFRSFEYIMERIPLVNLFSAHNVIVLTK
jgi:SAM-dependent methyltransferase